MAPARKASDIGLKQARQMCNMQPHKRLEFIAEGLPIIFDSAVSLIQASQKLEGFPREIEMLEMHAVEESAKILMLIDIVRCPPHLVSARMGPMMKCFYSHLARLIYAEAQSWKPTSAAELQRYIDDQRQSHYLEGEYGEYIMPNWELFRRESSLYADVAGNENADPTWISPLLSTPDFGTRLLPISYLIVDALSAFGIFSLPGLRVLSSVWGQLDVIDAVSWRVTEEKYDELVRQLDAAHLITERATKDHAMVLARHWQLPMYNMDFDIIDVSLDELNEQHEAQAPC